MNQSDLMIKVDKVKKTYMIGAIGRTSLKNELQRRKAKRRNLEDPTRKIGRSYVDEISYFDALSDVSFEVRRGECLGIIGHNGAGKSTLLRLITNITKPTEGMIYLNGNITSMLEIGTGFHSELTGRENVFLNGAILGMKKSEIDEKMDSIIEFSECAEFIDTPVKRYSSGMYIKLGFSVAAHLDSEIVIMDEVLAVGDVQFQNKCIDKMKEIAASGRTVLHVSHNMAAIRKLCTRCIVLDHGRIVFDGDVDKAIDVYLKYNGDNDKNVDIDKKKRAGGISGKAWMKNIEFIGIDTPVISMGEKMSFDITWVCREDFDHLRLRLGIWSSEHAALSFALSDEFSGRKDKENKTHFELDTSALIHGNYSMELMLVEVDENGTMIKHDSVRDAVFFDVTMSEKDSVFRSANRDWGHFTIPLTSGGTE